MDFLLQPINRTLLQEVNDNNSSREPMRFPVSAPVSAQAGLDVPAVAASSADDHICPEEAPAEARSADKEQGPEQSIEQLDPKTPGWTQRVRLGAAAPFRPPSADRITAFEKTVRQFAEDPGDIVIIPKI
ncbi:uncharacterized protein LOC119289640 [Triticum dicoccoides]|uniref:uncharacterized protein LOC119289640 n=1 Tax=Triticum dicoccoides TaxID=85692 RepID=UPI00188FBBB2|nr:uncharacterized protein LOC119289640 [Triticum dicoccoides]